MGLREGTDSGYVGDVEWAERDGWVRALMETEGLFKVISDLFNFLDGRATH